MFENVATTHVRFGSHAICRPNSLTAAVSSNDCKQCENKLSRLLMAACSAVVTCEASNLVMNQHRAGDAIRTLREEQPDA